MEETRINLSAALVQSIGDYLVTRPYREVVGLLAALQGEVQASARPNGPVRPFTERPIEEPPPQ